jgi:hypothetical protein
MVIKRYEGYETNPWLIETLLITEGNKIDVPLIIEKDLAVESGNEDKKGIIFGNNNG